MDMNKKVVRALFTIGSRGIVHARNALIDFAMMFDTAVAALAENGRYRFPIHMQVDPTRATPPHIPSCLPPEDGWDGVALRSWISARAMDADIEAHCINIERDAQRADVAFIDFSCGGGTGNGARPVLRPRIAKMHWKGRVIEISEIDPTVNPMKQGQRLADLVVDEPTFITSVVVRHAETAQEVIATPPRDWDLLLANVHNFRPIAAHTDLCFLQIRHLNFSEAAVIDAVVDGVIARDVPERWVAGMPGITPVQAERWVTDTVEALDELETRAAHADVPIEPVREAARRGERVLSQVRDAMVSRVTSEARAELDAGFEVVSANIPKVGLRRLGELEQLVGRLEDRLTKIEQALTTNDWRDALTQLGASEHGPRRAIARLMGRTPIDGVDPVRTFVRRRIAFENGRYTLRKLKQLTHPPTDASSTASPLFLPDGSPLLQRLVSVYCSAPGALRRTALRDAVEEQLAEVIVVALGPELPERLAFDFPTTFEAKANTGLVITSRFGAELGPLAMELHTDPTHVSTPTGGPPELTITHYQLVRRLRDVPVLADLAKRFNEVSATTDDRRLFARRANDIFPVPIRETYGVDLDRAAMLLVWATVVPSGLRITHGGSIELTMQSRASGGAQHHSIQDLATSLSVKAEHSIHDQFWSYFSANRVRCRAELAALAAGQRGRHDQARIAALMRFVGVTRWRSALERVAREAEIASAYWT